ncbi:mitogen-activated protein kinase kinase 9 [Biomphalaria glabrata]|uniref:Serine/threonine-protein kinase NIM1-like n=1 Tax=Biomphalaria glabrata TaxID=6526 RepID=A0A9W3BIA8_BIOGL|nr:serine/threonine-protein kinase NIM1-like [Biomphalaria glabrata]KAI8760819.1 mitogen-activated protein kinase kinase 9-like [Biomphalaria glabrata]
MYHSKKKKDGLLSYQDDACHVYGFEVEKLLQDNHPIKVFQVRSKQDQSVKKVIKTYFKDNTDVDQRTTRQFMAEISVLTKIHHPYVMGMDTMGIFPGYFAYVMPLYETGTLTEALPTMNQEKSDEYLVQLCAGLKFLHRHKIAHRDMKTDNVWSLLISCDMYALGVVYWCMVFKVDVFDLKSTEQMKELVNTLCDTSIDWLVLTNLLDPSPVDRLTCYNLLCVLEQPEYRFTDRIASLRGNGKMFYQSVINV